MTAEQIELYAAARVALPTYLRLQTITHPRLGGYVLRTAIEPRTNWGKRYVASWAHIAGDPIALSVDQFIARVEQAYRDREDNRVFAHLVLEG